jgi:hypothetical protein
MKNEREIENPFIHATHKALFDIDDLDTLLSLGVTG